MKDGKSKLLQAVRAVRNEIYTAVREQLADETKTYQQIADSVGSSLATVQRLAEKEGISRPVGPRSKTVQEKENNGKPNVHSTARFDTGCRNAA
jgi:DNA invertase Pin-like site-specific DNA recombinase